MAELSQRLYAEFNQTGRHPSAYQEWLEKRVEELEGPVGSGQEMWVRIQSVHYGERPDGSRSWMRVVPGRRPPEGTRLVALTDAEIAFLADCADEWDWPETEAKLRAALTSRGDRGV
jgi:hypothetical protein